DKSLMKAIVRGIQQSELGLNPTDDGSVVRVPIPSLTEERRKDLVRLVSKLAEEGRAHLRQVRHDALHAPQKQEKERTPPEAAGKRLETDAQKLTDRYIAMIDEMLKKKTAEVMEV